jgi:hypothetical protein
VSISSHRAMRRNGVRFGLFSGGERGHSTILLRLSTVLRNALATCDLLITPGKCWRKITWPEFQPSLPLGLLHLPHHDRPGSGPQEPANVPLPGQRGAPQRCFPPCPRSQGVLAHGPVCKPFAHERWLIRHERWPKAPCLRTDRWPTSARVGKPEGSCSQAATARGSTAIS